MLATTATLIGGAIAAGGSLLNGIFNNSSANKQTQLAKKQFEQNMAFQRETRDMAWQREDNAIQRATADATAAGFSPLAALGNTQNVSTVSAPSATAQAESGAGSFDQFANTMTSLATTEMNNRAAEKINQDNNKTKLEIEANQSKDKQAQRELDRQNHVDALKNAREIADASNNTTLKIANEALQEQITATTEQEKLKAAELQLQWYKEHHQEGAPMGKQCKTWDEYNDALLEWQNRYNTMLEIVGEDTDIQEEYGTSERDATYGGQIGMNAGGNNRAGSNVGIDAGVSAQGGGNTRNSKVTTTTRSKAAKQLEAWLKTHPQPIPPGISINGYESGRK